MVDERAIKRVDGKVTRDIDKVIVKHLSDTNKISQVQGLVLLIQELKFSGYPKTAEYLEATTKERLSREGVQADD